MLFVHPGGQSEACMCAHIQFIYRPAGEAAKPKYFSAGAVCTINMSLNPTLCLDACR